jgi:hypothetical protein
MIRPAGNTSKAYRQAGKALYNAGFIRIEWVMEEFAKSDLLLGLWGGVVCIQRFRYKAPPVSHTRPDLGKLLEC